MRFAFSLLLLLSSAAVWSQEPVRNPPPDVKGVMGWSGPQSLKHTAAWTAQQPKFELIHPATGEPVWQDNATARVVLWEDMAAANRGELPPNIRQLIGDCTSQGARNAIRATMAYQIAHGEPAEFRDLDTMFVYAAGRVLVAKGAFSGGGDGCSGASIARATREYGVLPLNTPGLPPYRAETARLWGRKGPPAEFLPIAAQHKVQTVALMRTADDVRDAICNGFGVTVASNWGSTNAAMREQDGRIVARKADSWSHQMASTVGGRMRTPRRLTMRPPADFGSNRKTSNTCWPRTTPGRSAALRASRLNLTSAPCVPNGGNRPRSNRREPAPVQPAVDPAPLDPRAIARPLKGSLP
jgi:hypothetical protein